MLRKVLQRLLPKQVELEGLRDEPTALFIDSGERRISARQMRRELIAAARVPPSAVPPAPT